ncbi:GNAT family N-acetyltransferase [uncultured Polaribacter sp.]|uniref:GNAT family N-acetyltransferase n=1 Tax=uncultured Polaribacter sp. TaxID=174711 RepID=UPI002616E7C2|nr:GNAT family N-acetyltransferase [uncultured Polaribacter sp.]
MIFETERLLIRKLKLEDLSSFYKLQNNPNVLKYADGEVKSFAENKIELLNLIARYQKADNDFWIYAIVNKTDKQFIGTLALVKEGLDDEIGYRFIEDYWGQGFGLEACKGLLFYCKNRGFKKLIAYVVDENIASKKILEKLNFKIESSAINKDLQLLETKYQIIL